MAELNSKLRIKRATAAAIKNTADTLPLGTPLFDTTNNYLYIASNSSTPINNWQPVTSDRLSTSNFLIDEQAEKLYISDKNTGSNYVYINRANGEDASGVHLDSSALIFNNKYALKSTSYIEGLNGTMVPGGGLLLENLNYSDQLAIELGQNQVTTHMGNDQFMHYSYTALRAKSKNIIFDVKYSMNDLTSDPGLNVSYLSDRYAEGAISIKGTANGPQIKVTGEIVKNEGSATQQEQFESTMQNNYGTTTIDNGNIELTNTLRVNGNSYLNGIYANSGKVTGWKLSTGRMDDDENETSYDVYTTQAGGISAHVIQEVEGSTFSYAYIQGTVEDDEEPSSTPLYISTERISAPQMSTIDLSADRLNVATINNAFKIDKEGISGTLSPTEAANPRITPSLSQIRHEYVAKISWNVVTMHAWINVYDANDQPTPVLHDETFTIYWYHLYGTVEQSTEITVKAGEVGSGAIYIGTIVPNIGVHFSDYTNITTFYQAEPSPTPSWDIRGALLPESHNTYNLGDSGHYWKDCYCNNVYGSVTTGSDRNLKNTITELTDKHEQLFDNLKPVTFKYNAGDSNRTHLGLIAQDLKQSIESAGLTTQDIAAYCEWETADGETTCGIRYTELIALNISEIQKLKARVAELESQIQGDK